MPRKMSIEEYLDQEFTENSRPTPRTVVNWIQSGAVPGTKVGGTWFVYVQETASDRLVNRVLKAV
ncbi:hypothetical protein GCM10007876_20980 [Litoribrevibacter albus]|uniref:DNA-binding protein n=1 Tax=Litoribrevibacter albus TaxID=1473156 RepID=A0AA37W7V4_9GAMM|nr:hypothetical protein GCM10007876_20980 [Litoribrevibacter albus]